METLDRDAYVLFYARRQGITFNLFGCFFRPPAFLFCSVLSAEAEVTAYRGELDVPSGVLLYMYIRPFLRS